MSASPLSEHAVDARRLIRAHFWGVLSTLSQKFAGYPFGSVVPVCPDYTGEPLILISRLAQHTRNILHSPQVSLTLVDAPAGNVQTEARATLVADAHALADDQIDAAAERYYRYFPEAQGYHTALDFHFFRLQVKSVRYIGGFGQIHWLAPELLTPNPFSPEQEQSIVGHMNEDHADAVALYWTHAGLPPAGHSPTMVAMDGESMVLRAGARLATIPLAYPVRDPLEARQCLVAMVKAAREAK